MKAKVNKSALIRAEFEKDPEARPVDVIKTLKKLKIIVTPQVVSNVRGVMRAKGTLTKITGSVGPMKTLQTGRSVPKSPQSAQDTDTIVKLAVVQDAAIKVGGLQNLEQLAQTLGNLQIPGFTR